MNMKKDALEFLATTKKVIEPKTLNELKGWDFDFLIFHPDVSIKMKAIHQKYKGDDLVKFYEVFKSVLKNEKETLEESTIEGLLGLFFMYSMMPSL